MAWRRVTKSENEKQWRGRYMKNTETGEVLTRTRYQGVQLGRARDAAYKELRKTRSVLATHKGRKTRGTKRELLELRHKYDKFDGKKDGEKAKREAAVINKYIASGHKYKKLTASDRRTFQEIFTRYPADTAREWLGSSEESRAIRRAWDEDKSWNKFPMAAE